MIGYPTALKLAQAWIKIRSSKDCECAVMEHNTITRPYGWVFYFGPIVPGPAGAVGGLCPILIDRINFEVRVIPCTVDVESYLATFEAAHPAQWLELTDEHFDPDYK